MRTRRHFARGMWVGQAFIANGYRLYVFWRKPDWSTKTFFEIHTPTKSFPKRKLTR